VRGATAEPELREVADGVFAYLQSGGWGFSNAGLVRSGSRSLLIDTLYDEALTRRMLDVLRGVHGGPIDTVVNTHANGDHCWGNAAVTGARLVSSRSAAEEMPELPPQLMHGLVRASRAVGSSKLLHGLLRLGSRLRVPRVRSLLEAAPFIVEHFGVFDFGNVRLRVPDATFDGALTLELDGRRVELIELGPAHTRGDVIAFVPDARVVFTGDLLFAGSHPVAWEGPIEGWIAACDRILALDADVIVAGHGPISTKRAIEDTKRYWGELLTDVRAALDSGLTLDETGRALAAKHARGWREESRILVNVDTIGRGLLGLPKPDPLALLAAMARYERSA
jgi:glyoxylase-like metal-dependent hydrolase (beta-lactamase superfamily II)